MKRSSHQHTGKVPQQHDYQRCDRPINGRISVEQYNLTTRRTIARFNSLCEAERATGVGNACISSCIRGKQKQAGGFGWRSSTYRTGAAGSSASRKNGGKPSSSSSSSSGSRTLGFGRGDGHYQAQGSFEGESGADIGEIDVDEEEEGVYWYEVDERAPVTPVSHGILYPASSSYSSAAAAASSSSPSSVSSSPSSSSSSYPVSPPLPMITERQRQQLRDAILDILLHHFYSDMPISETLELKKELFVRATTIENVFFQYDHEEYEELFDRARLLDTLNYSSIKALYTL